MPNGQGGKKQVNKTRFWASFHRLQELGKRESGAYRVAWTQEDQEARQTLLSHLRSEGLCGYQDGAGNVWGLWTADPDQPYVLMGSHLDSVPGGGDFDGVYGVAAALEALLSIRETDEQPGLNLAVVAFADEEGVNYHSGLFGSRAVCGLLTREDFSGFMNSTGSRSLAEAARAFGVSWESIAALESIRVSAYLELHVEQGPYLDLNGIPIGVVDVIAGRTQGLAQFAGKQNHAGTTPMSVRHDALLYAAEAAIALNRIVGRRDAVGTVGQLEVRPGAPNVIASSASVSFDVRSPEDSVRNAVVEEWTGTWQSGNILKLSQEPAVYLQRSLQDVAVQAAKKRHLRTARMPSWAVHDAMVMAKKVPTALIFIPSAQGISHAPDERSDPEHCEWGVWVLEDSARTLGRMNFADT